MLWNNIRYTLRLMRRSPGFTAAAVLSLALGIGANTAIFSLFYTIVLRHLPVEHPEQLVELVIDSPDELHWAGYWAWENYEYFRDHNRVFSGVTGMSFDNLASVHTPGSELETLIRENVPGNYFQMLGLTPAAGRLIGPEDVPVSGSGNVAVVSWSYWNRRFHRDPAIVGKRLFYNGALKTIIGVAPRDYVGPRVGSRTDLWIPVKNDSLTMLARLKPGVTIENAQAQIAVLYRALLAQESERRWNLRQGTRIELVPAAAGLVRVRDQYGKPLMLLLAVVGLLLLLACINLASLLLARAAGRRREIAVRVGLGANRRHLVGQMLTEAIVLSLAGALSGILFAHFATGLLVRIMASGRAFEHIDIQVQPDLPLLLFTTGIALLTGLLFGLAPAWHVFRFAPESDLRQSGKGSDTRLWRLLGKGLVTTQVALSIFLVVAAAIFLNHLSRLRNFDLGFSGDRVLLVTLDSTRSGFKPEQLAALYQTLLPRLEAIPGVLSASISGCTPLEGCGSPGRYMSAEGHVEPSARRQRTAVTFVAPRYFETLGIPLLAGRDFTFQDAGRRRVAIINQTMARRYFSGIDPIGKHIMVDRNSKPGWFGSNQPYEIVGLARDVKAFELRDPPYPTAYFNMFQENQLMDHFALRTVHDPAFLSATVQRIMRSNLRTVPLIEVTTLAAQVDSNIVPERLIATLSQFFGLLGAALAGIGLYGLLAHTVVRRTREFGIRMAVGATARDVISLVLRDALEMLCGGMAVGIALVLLTRPLLVSLIQDLRPDMTEALVLGGCIMIGVALVAAYVPVCRAIRVDPTVALRHD